MKKIISLLLSALLITTVFTALPFSAAAAAPGSTAYFGALTAPIT